MNQLNQFKTAASQACPKHLAIASVGVQTWNGVYDLTTALKEGTIFPELNMPFFMGDPIPEKKLY